MLKYIFAGIFVAIAWTTALVFESVPLWMAGAATGFIALLLITLVLIRAMAARRAQSGLESALGKDASGNPDGVRPEQLAEIKAMQAEFQKALRTLKASRVGGGKNPLGALPWYVIIGPPGSGKSTVLRNSGLKFPFLSKSKGSVRGVGGTRNCDWWLSNEAILLDTAGRWATEDEDEQEWFAFLDMLKRTRRGKALNGIMVTVGVDELLGASEDEVAELAQKLRARADEVMQRLGIVMPCYLIITKCDLLSGFIESFSGLNEKDRRQIWGFTMPLDTPNDERTDLFVEKLEELLHTLELRNFKAIAEEPQVGTRRSLFEFPQQFEQICPVLVGLVNELFAGNVYQETPLLRGVYFTSGTQEGRPIDRIMQKMADAFGIAPSVQLESNVQAKSYFLGDVFRKVMFPDQDVAMLSGGSLRRRRILRWAGAGAAGLIAVIIAMTPLSAYRANVELGNQVKELARGLAASLDGKGRLTDLERLQKLDSVAKTLLSYEVDGPPTSMQFGFYQGVTLETAVVRSLKAHVIEPLLAETVAQFALFNRGSERIRFDVARDYLRDYLIVTGPKPTCDGSCCEPTPESKDWDERILAARDGLAEQWREARVSTGKKPTVDAVATVKRLIELYLRVVRRHAEYWGGRDEQILADTRRSIKTRSKQNPLDRLVNDPQFKQFDLKLDGVLGGSSGLFKSDSQNVVQGAYTVEGWGLVKKHFAAMEKGDSDLGCGANGWIVGTPDRLEPEEIVALRKGYFKGYDRQWRGLLSRLYPECPHSLEDAQITLGRHADERPLNIVWQTVHDNLELDKDPTDKLGGKLAAAADKAAELLGKKPDPDVEELKKGFESFVDFGIASRDGATAVLDSYYAQLSKLGDAVAEYNASKDAGPLRSVAESIKREAAGMIARYRDGNWGAVLTKILMPPINCTLDQVVGAGAEAANRRWCESVVVPWEQTLQKRFPFVGDGREADLQDIERFFAPGAGILWQFYEEALKKDVRKLGGTFKVNPDATVHYNKNLLDALDRADRLTALLFNKGASTLEVPLQVRVHPSTLNGGFIRQINFELGENKVIQRNTGETWEPLRWPARDIRILVMGTRNGAPVLDNGLKFDGDWALFKLLAQARVSARSDAGRYIKVELASPREKVPIDIDLQPAGLQDAFRGVSIPRAVAGSGRSCLE